MSPRFSSMCGHPSFKEYCAYSAQGASDVEPGTARKLSRREQLEVIATAQTEGLGNAVVLYLECALQGRFPLRNGFAAALAKKQSERW
jgi:hypothetical protein